MSVFWQIVPPGGAPSYLLGTMHVRDARVFRDWEKYRRRLAECQVFMPEYDLYSPDAQAFLHVLTMPSEQRLESLLPPPARKRLERLLRIELGMTLDNVAHLSPFALLQLLSEHCMGSEHHLPLDAALYSAARDMGMSCIGLETLEEHFGVLDKVPDNNFSNSLRGMLRNFGHFRRKSQQMLQWYERGELHDLLRYGRKQLGAFRGPMLFDRNALMTKTFCTQALQGPVFAAVGAAHLPGGKGMLRGIKHELGVSPRAI